MEVGLEAQIEKLEAKLKCYQRDNEELQNMNMKSEMLIKLHKMQKERKEQKKFRREQSYRKIVGPN